VILISERFEAWGVSSANRKLEIVRATGPRSGETAGLLIKARHPNTSLLFVVIVSGAELFVLTIRHAVCRKSIASTRAAASSCMCGST